MCKKFSYMNREAAEDAIRHTNANAGSPILLTMAYECRRCGWFHTSSVGSDPRQTAAKQQKYSEVEYWTKKLKINHR